MVIGNGLLARSFSEYVTHEDFVIIASGVSNSSESRQSEFDRERKLIEEVVGENPEKHLVFFSTSSMYNAEAYDTPYVRHKLELEHYLRSHSDHYTIFRISQLIGKSNNATLVNFLVKKITKDEEVQVWTRATRNLIEVGDAVKIMDVLLQQNLASNKIINIASTHNTPILGVVESVAEVLKKKPKMKLVNKGMPYGRIDIKYTERLMRELGLDFENKDYIKKALIKHML